MFSKITFKKLLSGTLRKTKCQGELLCEDLSDTLLVATSTNATTMFLIVFKLQGRCYTLVI